MELLAPFRTEIDGTRRALQTTADALGISLDELWTQVVHEWGISGKMEPTWLPRAFREGRTLYTLKFPQGWWVDVTAAETIAALNDLPRGALSTEKGPLSEPLTLSHITGDDRVLTTSIATVLRESATLDDGSLPLGVLFTSKHGRPVSGAGEGRCWAYWMRQVDSGLKEPTQILRSSGISEHDPELKAVQRLCKIKTR